MPHAPAVSFHIAAALFLYAGLHAQALLAGLAGYFETAVSFGYTAGFAACSGVAAFFGVGPAFGADPSGIAALFAVAPAFGIAAGSEAGSFEAVVGFAVGPFEAVVDFAVGPFEAVVGFAVGPFSVAADLRVGFALEAAAHLGTAAGRLSSVLAYFVPFAAIVPFAASYSDFAVSGFLHTEPCTPV